MRIFIQLLQFWRTHEELPAVQRIARVSLINPLAPEFYI